MEEAMRQTNHRRSLNFTSHHLALNVNPSIKCYTHLPPLPEYRREAVSKSKGYKDRARPRDSVEEASSGLHFKLGGLVNPSETIPGEN